MLKAWCLRIPLSLLGWVCLHGLTEKIVKFPISTMVAIFVRICLIAGIVPVACLVMVRV